MRIHNTLIKIFIIIGLGFLVISAFVIRKHNFEVSPRRSVDEEVYFGMAYNIQKGLQYYNTQYYGEILREAGRYVPEYFLKPLYKHPPVFTLLLSLSIKLFGVRGLSAFYVPVFFSLMTIPLVYCLGALIFNRWVGFFAAILLTLDPMSIVCSQKVWMESVLAFFTVFSIYAFVKGLKTDTPRLFISSGILSGLGALTKYTGVLPTMIFISYALLLDRKLFRNKYFLVSLIIPFIMLIPWLIWNISVYGLDFFGMQASLHSDKYHVPKFTRNIIIYIVFGLAVYRLVKKVKKDISNPRKAEINIRLVISSAFAALLWPAIISSFMVTYLPVTSWAGATFYGSIQTFYLERLLQFSLLTFFTFLAFCLPKRMITREELLVRVSIVIILLFYTIWSAYQSRYIIAVNPLIILIGVNFLYELFMKTHSINSFMNRILARSVIFILVYMILVKLFFINKFISYPNDLCYF